jgi:hypothetical protein
MKIEVGSKLYFMGLEPEVEIISINEANNSWIGRDFDNDQLYPLDEIEKYWVGSDISKLRKYTLSEVKEYWENKGDINVKVR